MERNDTASMILDVAQQLLQTRGYNGFSIKDVASRLQIRTSSLHYHFPTKADLCRALIARHRQRVSLALQEVDRQATDARKKLGQFIALFQSTIEAGNRMCPFGMLASDADTLEPVNCEELRASFDDLENWLSRVLLEGRKAGVLRFTESARKEARLVLSTLEGAMLVARTYHDPLRFAAVAHCLLAKFYE